MYIDTLVLASNTHVTWYQVDVLVRLVVLVAVFSTEPVYKLN